MKDCFGSIPLDKKDLFQSDLVKEHAGDNGCYECPERYNCICLSSVITGAHDNENFDSMVKDLRLGIRSDDFNNKIKRHYENITGNKFVEDGIEMINGFFFKEIKKPEYKDVKDLYIKYIKGEYSDVKKKHDLILKLMTNMERFFEELDVDIEEKDE